MRLAGTRSGAGDRSHPWTADSNSPSNWSGQKPWQCCCSQTPPPALSPAAVCSDSWIWLPCSWKETDFYLLFTSKQLQQSSCACHPCHLEKQFAPTSQQFCLGGSIGMLLTFPKTQGKGVTEWSAQWGKADGLQGWGDHRAVTTALEVWWWWDLPTLWMLRCRGEHF